MATVLGSLLVQLGMESAEFDRGINRAQQNMAKASRQFQVSGQQIQRSAGNVQQGMQQLSFQLNDIATQWASGTRPMQIFAQQSGQVVQAIALMSNGAKGFGAFMAGPWGMAITAGVVVLGGLISKLGEAENALDDVKFASSAVGDAQGILGNVMDMTTGKINTQSKALIALANAQLLVARVQAQTRAAEARRGVTNIQNRPLSIGGGFGGGLSGVRRPQDARDFISREVLAGRMDGKTAVDRLENLRRIGRLSDTEFAEAASSIANLGVETENLKVFDEAEALLNGTGGSSLLKPGKDKKSGGGKKGKDAAAIEKQFNDERASLMQQYNSALGSMAMSAEEAAEYEMRNVELTRLRALANISANKDYSEDQKKVLRDLQEQATEREREKIEREKARRIEDEANQAKQQEYQETRAALQSRMALANTEQERQDIALQLLALDQEYQRQALQRVIASETRTDAEKALAQQALDALERGALREQGVTMRQTETTAQRYMRDLQKTPGQINEAIDQIKINGLERLNDELVDAIINFKSIGDVASSVFKQILAELLRLQIQQSLIQPLASALGLGGGLGGGGFLGGIFGGGGLSGAGAFPVGGLGDAGLSASIGFIPGFATGTNFAPGGLAWVGERGRELINLPRGSQVIPNNDISKLAANNNNISIGAINVSGEGMTERQARQTGAQIYRGIREEQAKFARMGA